MDRHGLILVIGLGNALLGDLGFGISALHALRRRQRGTPGIAYHRSRVVSTALLPLLAESHALLLLEARPYGAPPGAMLDLEGTDMDEGLLCYPSTDPAFSAELVQLAATGELPDHRAILIVQPAPPRPVCELSTAVAARIPEVVLRAGTHLSVWGACLPIPHPLAIG